jgi:hypothetical protein
VYSRFLFSVLIARKEKKQLQAKRIQAKPANSSKYVLWLILEIFNEVIMINENPKRLLDAFRI